MYITEGKLVYKNFFVYTQYSRKFVQKYKNLLCIHSTVENLYKNSAVEMLHLIDWQLNLPHKRKEHILLMHTTPTVEVLRKSGKWWYNYNLKLYQKMVKNQNINKRE